MSHASAAASPLQELRRPTAPEVKNWSVGTTMFSSPCCPFNLMMIPNALSKRPAGLHHLVSFQQMPNVAHGSLEASSWTRISPSAFRSRRLSRAKPAQLRGWGGLAMGRGDGQQSGGKPGQTPPFSSLRPARLC